MLGGYTGPVSLSLSSNPDSDTLQGTTSVSAVNGIATFSGLSLDIAASGDVLRASAGNLTTATTGSLTVAPGAAAQVAITTAPPSNLTAGGSFGLTASVEDASGNVVSSYTGPVSLTLSSNPGSGTLLGTTSVYAVNGVATFTGLSLNTAASGYVLQAASGNLTTATTDSLTVAPGAPAQVAITSPPAANLTAGAAFGLTASVEDASGNVVSSYTGAVSLNLSSNPGSGTLQGTTSVNVVNGVAPFSGLTLDTAGSGYVLQAASGNLTTATTGSLTVAPAGPAQLVITSAPPSSVTAGGAFGLTVKVEDVFGSVDTPYNGPVSLALSSNPGHAALQGNLTATAVAGVATFSGLSIDTAAAGYTLRASLGNVTATTGSLTVTPGQATQLAITTPPPSNLTAGSPFGLTVTAKDGFGNVVTSYTGPVTLALASNPGKTSLQGKTTVNAIAGVATFSGLSLSSAAAGYTLQATLGNVTATTGSLTVRRARPRKWRSRRSRRRALQWALRLA